MTAKIMIIDAHPVYASKMEGFLESLAFKEIVVVARGLEAMETIMAHKPALIILSAALPDIDSVILARQIKARFTIPMIVQTGLLTNQRTIEELTSAGAEYVLPRKEKDWSVFENALTTITASLKS